MTRPEAEQPAAKELFPAATVVPLRDGAEGLELLLLRRNESLAFLGGAWVFPGGRIDAGDFVDGAEDITHAARHAAVREAYEEAGIRITSDSLVQISRWVPPPQANKRFETWFFLARSCEGDVRVDGGEIIDFRWISARDAMAAQGRKEIVLAPPTFVTLHGLLGFSNVQAALVGAAESPVEVFSSRIRVAEGGAYSLYAGDVAYEGGELTEPGLRHRLFMSESGWHYERSD